MRRCRFPSCMGSSRCCRPRLTGCLRCGWRSASNCLFSPRSVLPDPIALPPPQNAPQQVLLTRFLFCFSLLVAFAFLLWQYLSVHFSPGRSMQLKLFTLTAINSNELGLKIPCVQFYKISNPILTSPSDKPPLQIRRVLRHRLKMPYASLKPA